MPETVGRSAAAWIIALTGCALAVVAVLTAASQPRPIGLVLVLATGCVLYSLLGGVVVARSRHPAGPLLAAAGIGAAAALALATAEDGSSLDLAAAAALAGVVAALAIALVSLPEGTLATRRRRTVAALSVTGAVVVSATAAAGGLSEGSWGAGWWLGGAPLAAAWVGACVSLLVRARSSTGAERSKVAWPAAGALLTAAAAAGLALADPGVSLESGDGWSSAAWAVTGLALPVCLIVGAVRWKLFDVWRLAGYLGDYRLWTASFAVLAAAVVGAAAALVGIAAGVPWGTAIAIGAWAVVAAVLARAARAHLQERVDRRFGQRQEDPAKTLEEFTERWAAADWDPSTLRGPVFDVLGHVAPIVVVEGVDGIRFAVRTSDREIGRHTFVHGAYDLPTMELAARVLAEHGQEVRGRGFLDVGANIGTSAIVAVRRFGASGCVAIEPGPENLELLRWNIALNGMQDVATIVPVALSDHEGRLMLELSESNAGDHRLRTAPQGSEPEPHAERRETQVDVIRLDELIDRGEVRPERLGLMWMDVQGHEGHVLTGAWKLLTSGVPIVAELWPVGLRRSGGQEMFWDALEVNYRWAVDLRRGPDEGSRQIPISLLRSAIGDVDDPEWFTDILVMR